MTDKYFLDTNVLIYGFDREQPIKRQKAQTLVEQLLDSGDYYISFQVANEFCNIALKKIYPALSVADIRDFIATIPESQVVPLNLKAVYKALDIHQRYQFSFWDSLILATALLHQCSVVFSEDLSHLQTIENITVVNPFREV